MSFLKVENLNFGYTPDSEIFYGLNFELTKGELVALLGPSGKGKSSFLHICAGFLAPSSGKVIFQGREVYCSQNKIDIPPEKRGMGIVFQDHCLFPHLTISQNIAYGMDKKDSSEIGKYLEMVKLSHKANAKPQELSGGEQQRISIARALAAKPQLLLMDEPFSSLDEELRIELRTEVAKLLRELEVSAILVTHSKEEASSFCDRLVEL
jgi:iron(III) transport system ATP-binding protein